jgi:hypothetical protein
VPTPLAASRKTKSFANKTKDFSKELQVLAKKFDSIPDLAYDKQKVDMVLEFTEKAIEKEMHLDILIERLKVLEQMHSESPNIEALLSKIILNTTKEVPEALHAEKTQVEAVRAQMVAAAADLDATM